MSVIIKPLKNIKKISKQFSKEIKNLIKSKPRSRIGIDWNNSIKNVLDVVKKNKKIDWYNTKIFSLSEYKTKQIYSLENDLFKDFVDSINIYKNNFESMVERIESLSSKDKIEHLYNFEGGIDLMIFSIDSRGNFVFNDYESEISLINSANNGNDIYSPGIASILMAKKIICFVLDEATENVLKTLNNKTIEENDALTYLQLHPDCTIYTFSHLISKKEINKDVATQDYSSFRKQIADIQEQLKVNILEEPQQLFEEQIEEENNLDGVVPDNLDSNNYNKNNLDKELEETLQKNEEELDDVSLEEKNLFAKELEEEIEEETTPEDIEQIAKEVLEDENEKLLSEFEKTLGENEHITDYQINEDEQIYVVENLGESIDLDDQELQENLDQEETLDESYEQQELGQDEIDVEQEPSEEISESMNIVSSLDFVDEDFVELNLDADSPIEETIEEELQPITPDDLEKELLIEQTEDVQVDNLEESNQEPIDLDPEATKEKLRQIYEEEIKNIELTSNEDILKLIEIKTDTLKSIEKMILQNKLDKLKDRLLLESLKETAKKEEIEKINAMPSYVKLVYIPGTRPVPLLMYEQTPDEFEYVRTYSEMLKTLRLNIVRKKFTANGNHLWNMGSYFSYNTKTNEIDLLAFSNFANFLWLLRVANKPLFFYLRKEDYLKLKEDLDELKDELLVLY